MKAFWLITLLAISSALGADTGETKDAPAAVSQTESALAANPSAEGYYNLALDAEKSGDATRAILNYQRALLLDPGLSTARNALAKLTAPKGIPLPPGTWVNDVNAVAHPDTRVIVGAILIWAAIFGLMLALNVPKRRVAVNALAVLGLILGGAILTTGWLGDARMTKKEPALVISRDGAEVLASPSSNSTPVISLPQGTAVDVLSPRGAWSYVDLNGTVRGWVQTERLEPLVPGATL